MLLFVVQPEALDAHSPFLARSSQPSTSVSGHRRRAPIPRAISVFILPRRLFWFPRDVLSWAARAAALRAIVGRESLGEHAVDPIGPAVVVLYNMVGDLAISALFMPNNTSGRESSKARRSRGFACARAS